MKITFHGAAQTVTGSQILIQANDNTILLECGLYQGKRENSYQRNRNFPFDPSKIYNAILSHAHIDHSGNIPSLVKKGFANQIFATPPTVDLCKIMLKDSAYLQEKDIEWVNRIRMRKHEKIFKPLYTIHEAIASLDRFCAVDYNKTFTIAPGIQATFRDAGHILGSASILLEIEEHGKTIRCGFTGDIGQPDMPVIHDPDELRDLDVLIMESTYGNRSHSPHEDILEHLSSLINEIASSGGKIIIPAFAVGRTQLIVYLLHKLFIENRIPDMPIFVDSPMAVKVTDVFRQYEHLLDRETKRIFLRDEEDPFSFKRLTYITDVEESKKLNQIKYPHIIISASGMAEGGRILHHLKNNVGNHRNMVLFVGYAARDTLARKIMDGERTIKIFGEEYQVKCKVETMDSFSAHADRQALLNYVKINSPEKLKYICLFHGDHDQAEPLLHALRSQGYAHVLFPAENESVTITS